MTKWLMTLVVRISITIAVSMLALGGYSLYGNREQDFEQSTKGVSVPDLVTGKQWKEFHAASGYKFDSTKTEAPTPSNVSRKMEILREVFRDWWTTPRPAVSDNATRQKELRRQFHEVTKRLDDAQPNKRANRVGAR